LFCRLQGHFGEVALHSSGAFTIEKCFTACNLSLRETIVSELLAVQSELSKTKQGSYLLRKLDVDGYAVVYLLCYGISISIYRELEIESIPYTGLKLFSVHILKLRN